MSNAGGRTRRLSGVNRTVTPASTLPTVRDTSIVAGAQGLESMLDTVADREAR